MAGPRGSRLRRLCWVRVSLGLRPPPLQARGANTNGAVVPGVCITVRNEATGLGSSGEANKQVYYTIHSLAVSRHSMMKEHP